MWRDEDVKGSRMMVHVNVPSASRISGFCFAGIREKTCVREPSRLKCIVGPECIN